MLFRTSKLGILSPIEESFLFLLEFANSFFSSSSSSSSSLILWRIPDYLASRSIIITLWLLQETYFGLYLLSQSHHARKKNRSRSILAVWGRSLSQDSSPFWLAHAQNSSGHHHHLQHSHFQKISFSLYLPIAVNAYSWCSVPPVSEANRGTITFGCQAKSNHLATSVPFASKLLDPLHLGKHPLVSLASRLPPFLLLRSPCEPLTRLINAQVIIHLLWVMLPFMTPKWVDFLPSRTMMTTSSVSENPLMDPGQVSSESCFLSDSQSITCYSHTQH